MADRMENKMANKMADKMADNMANKMAENGFMHAFRLFYNFSQCDIDGKILFKNCVPRRVHTKQIKSLIKNWE